MINSEIKYFQSKCDKIRGSNDKEVFYEARQIFRRYDKKRRLPYVRSKYFGGQKVFLNLFYKHLAQKSPGEQRKRIAFVGCAIDLLQNSKMAPNSFIVNKIEYFRFYGKTKSGENFAVQVMKDKKSNRYSMSCFPVKSSE